MEPHHLLCTRCGSLTDVPLDAVVGYAALAFAATPPAEALELAVLIRGVCGSCVRETD